MSKPIINSDLVEHASKMDEETTGQGQKKQNGDELSRRLIQNGDLAPNGKYRRTVQFW